MSLDFSPPTQKAPVAIIGAGLSGLHAAWLLHRAGIPFTVFEARDVAGGRILTVDVEGKPAQDGFDLGASWFWPHMQPAIAQLVQKLALPTFAQWSEGDILVERFFREGPRRYAGNRQEAASFRLKGGTGQLIHALMKQLPSENIRFNAPVSHIALDRDALKLSINSADEGPKPFRASHVIAALPPRVLQATITFSPAQSSSTQNLWRETPTWMAPHAKFIAIYDRSFWRDQGLSGTAQSMAGPLMEIHDATTASGLAGLMGFFGVSAQDRRSIPAEELHEAAISQLVRLFGPDAAHPRSRLIKDWAQDPLTATSADQTGAGHASGSANDWVSHAWNGRLFLAGSETSPTEAGYLSGAIEASQIVVEQILHRS